VNRGFFGSSISALALLCIASSASAHHPPHFDRCKLYTVSGDIERIEWANPHVKLTLKSADGMTYDLLWRSIQQLSLAGVEKDAVRVGDHVEITGSKQADDGGHVSMLLSELHKACDGLQWSQPPQGC
jgi:hypothetical protein